MGSDSRPADALTSAPEAPAGGAEATERKRRRSFEPEVKAKAVVRVLAGEAKASVALDLGVSLDRLSRWQSNFYSAGLDALANKSSAPKRSKFKANSGTPAQWILLALVVLASVIALLRLLLP